MVDARLCFVVVASLIVANNTSHAESVVGPDPDIGVPSCQCDDDCVPYGFEVCHLGECHESGFDGIPTPCAPCVAPYVVECNGGCFDPSNDVNHCGGCNKACGDGFTCVNGQCSCSETVCKGRCVALDTDLNNCGECANSCGGNESCVEGLCTCETDDGNALCDGECVNLTDDRNNCGACGKECPPMYDCGWIGCYHRMDGGSLNRISDAGLKDAMLDGMDASASSDQADGAATQTNPTVDPTVRRQSSCSVAEAPQAVWLVALLLVALRRRWR